VELQRRAETRRMKKLEMNQRRLDPNPFCLEAGGLEAVAVMLEKEHFLV